MTLAAIARQLNCADVTVSCVIRGHFGAGRANTWGPRSGRLSVQEREQILLGLARGDSLSAIARSLGRSPSTVTREVAANGGREHYGVYGAHHRAREQTRRPKPGKLVQGPLAREVTCRLEQFWSPKEIAYRLPLDYPDNPDMRVSHETIYQSLYVQGRGELRQ
jgi:IS30 family transposase